MISPKVGSDKISPKGLRRNEYLLQEQGFSGNPSGLDALSDQGQNLVDPEIYQKLIPF
jgi:hypothetical protein